MTRPHLQTFLMLHFLAAQSSGLLMVAGVAKTKRSVLTQVITELSRFRLPVLGFVPNHPGRGTANAYNQPGQYLSGKPTLLENLKILKPNE